jgi:hypothetical protein
MRELPARARRRERRSDVDLVVGDHGALRSMSVGVVMIVFS